MPPQLILCRSCACHAKAIETHCPCCGSELHSGRGGILRPAAAAVMAMGLMTGACSDDSGTSEGAGGDGAVSSAEMSSAIAGYIHSQVSSSSVGGAGADGGDGGTGGAGGAMGGTGGAGGTGGSGG